MHPSRCTEEERSRRVESTYTAAVISSSEQTPPPTGAGGGADSRGSAASGHDAGPSADRPPGVTPRDFPVAQGPQGELVVRRVLGPDRVVQLGANELAERVEAASRVVADVGTGDGRAALEHARNRPDLLVVAIDLNRDNLAECARKAARPAARGGCPNLIYVWADAGSPPFALHGLADAVWVLYPWGSLLAGIVEPDRTILHGLRALGTPGGTFSFLLNLRPWQQSPRPHAVRELPQPSEDDVRQRLDCLYRQEGLQVEDIGTHLLHGPPRRRKSGMSSWERRLAARVGPATLAIEGTLQNPV